MSWQAISPIPSRMARPHSIELNGLIYVAGISQQLHSNLSEFWCYDPPRNEWTQKEGFNIDFVHPHMFKTKQNICAFSGSGNFKTYDSAMNSWKMVISSGNINLVICFHTSSFIRQDLWSD